MHGMVMVFFFLIPSIPAVLGNFLVPMMIGAKDLAFPRINLLKLRPLHIIGGVMMLHCMLTGGVDTGSAFLPMSPAAALTKHPLAEYGPTPPGTPARADLQAADVPVDNSAAPGLADPKPQRQLPARRTGESTRHRSLVSRSHSRDRESAVDPQLIIRLMVLTGGRTLALDLLCLPRTHPTCLPPIPPEGVIQMQDYSGYGEPPRGTTARRCRCRPCRRGRLAAASAR